MTDASRITAMIFNSPPQFGQCSRSISAPIWLETAVVRRARSHAAPLTVVSDCLGWFTVIAGQGEVHDRVITSGAKDSVNLPQFNAINTLLGNLKTALTGTYQSIKFTSTPRPT